VGRQQSFGLDQSKMSSCETENPLLSLLNVGELQIMNKNNWCTFFIHETECLFVSSYNVAVAKMFNLTFLAVQIDMSLTF
jgi:hypothetical protein